MTADEIHYNSGRKKNYRMKQSPIKHPSNTFPPNPNHPLITPIKITILFGEDMRTTPHVAPRQPSSNRQSPVNQPSTTRQSPLSKSRYCSGKTCAQVCPHAAPTDPPRGGPSFSEAPRFRALNQVSQRAPDWSGCSSRSPWRWPEL